MTAAGCDEFQIAIEQRQHGAKLVVSVEALTQHLHGCPSCGRYAALAAETERAMSVSESMNWRVFSSTLNTTLARDRIGAVTGFAAGVLVLIMVGAFAPHALLPGALAFVIGMTFMLRSLLFEQADAKAAQLQGELFVFLSAHFDRQLREAQVGRVGFALLGAGICALPWARSLVGWPPSTTRILVSTGLGLACLAYAAFLHLRTLPDLRAQRSTLHQADADASALRHSL
jgi:hypothetical protein